jgi:hypothetical protein
MFLEAYVFEMLDTKYIEELYAWNRRSYQKLLNKMNEIGLERCDLTWVMYIYICIIKQKTKEKIKYGGSYIFYRLC